MEKEMGSSVAESGGTASPKSEGQRSAGNRFSDPAHLPPYPDIDDDGYPTDEWVEALREHDFNPFSAARWLTTDFVDAAGMIACCQVSVEHFDDDHDGKSKRLTFVTGGWSGAEDLIGAALHHFWIRHYYTMWKAGGLFEFVVPNKMTRAPAENSASSPSEASAGNPATDEPISSTDPAQQGGEHG